MTLLSPSSCVLQALTPLRRWRRTWIRANLCKIMRTWGPSITLFKYWGKNDIQIFFSTKTTVRTFWDKKKTAPYGTVKRKTANKQAGHTKVKHVKEKEFLDIDGFQQKLFRVLKFYFELKTSRFRYTFPWLLKGGKLKKLINRAVVINIVSMHIPSYIC